MVVIKRGEGCVSHRWKFFIKGTMKIFMNNSCLKHDLYYNPYCSILSGIRVRSITTILFGLYKKNIDFQGVLKDLLKVDLMYPMNDISL